ncbi:hypothetical protein KDW_04550 [Dictyobacter vulcani]|uniref:SWIM-type domain-containing protein n=1 Tax=Dictyobacter vulcani TaxID=2607529 RepID=A0A5J4KFC1_9CHLR|nr:hypothetical protein [Dictyobacter vulcani]GER86293.1 hypothetical protein KDW_04550 [Dictyobacter vulcani]
MPPSAHTTSPLEPKMIRQHIRTLIRSQYRLHPREATRQTHAVLNEIWQFVAITSIQLQVNEQRQALLTLKAVTDVLTEQWMHLNDIHGEVSDFFQELTRVWTETALQVDLTATERKRWAKQITSWQTRLADWHSIHEAFAVPQAALREGWDHVPLQRILQGTAHQERAWDGEIPAYAPHLTRARLTVLEQQERFQEYLYLAKAEGQTRAYVTMLVRQGQISEAISYGQHHLTTVEDALAVAQALWTHGARSEGLQIADLGITLDGDRVPLAIWLRDQSWRIGEQAQALKAGEVAFQGEPTLKHYLHLAHIAGTQWPQYRARLLDSARQAPSTTDAHGLLQIFLHEHLFEDAIAVLKTDRRHTLVALVVDAALKEQTVLEWVVQACRQQAEHIMNGAKASYYQAAANWLTKARTAYHLLGQDDTWHVYLADLVERHQHKSKLRPLLIALA